MKKLLTFVFTFVLCAILALQPRVWGQGSGGGHSYGSRPTVAPAMPVQTCVGSACERKALVATLDPIEQLLRILLHFIL